MSGNAGHFFKSRPIDRIYLDFFSFSTTSFMPEVVSAVETTIPNTKIPIGTSSSIGMS
jgi:hypothetical protein